MTSRCESPQTALAWCSIFRNCGIPSRRVRRPVMRDQTALNSQSDLAFPMKVPTKFATRLTALCSLPSAVALHRRGNSSTDIFTPAQFVGALNSWEPTRTTGTPTNSNRPRMDQRLNDRSVPTEGNEGNEGIRRTEQLVGRKERRRRKNPKCAAIRVHWRLFAVQSLSPEEINRE
jgi:hypothetical protein